MQELPRLTQGKAAVNLRRMRRSFEPNVVVAVQPFKLASRTCSEGSQLVRRSALRAEDVPADRTRDDHLAMVSHELRNSLSVVRNSAALLRGPQTVAGVIEHARLLIERHVGQMSRLIEDLLEESHTTQAPLSFKRERIDLLVLVRQVIEDSQLDMDRRGHRLTVSLPNDSVWLSADSGRLEQVFANLLMNAAKYTHNGGDITLTVERRLECASVRIRDSGIGIAREVLPCVFALFTQAAPSAPLSERGHGIGLAVVRNFVEMHGGSVSATSDGLGRGSEFTVLLPTPIGAGAPSLAPPPQLAKPSFITT